MTTLRRWRAAAALRVREILDDDTGDVPGFMCQVRVS